MFNSLLYYLFIAIAALIAIIFHELAHGLMSYMLGDPTPKRQGRLSLNPAKHLDPVGTVCLILFHVGWAKPVVINSEYYKHKHLGMFLVALAGPFTNFIIAIISMFVYGFIYKFTGFKSTPAELIATFFYLLAIINLGLGVFNLIPIPPLDGSKILGSFLRGKVYDQYMKYQQYGFLILALVLLLSSLAGSGMSFVTTAVEYIANWLLLLVSKILAI